MLSNIIYNSISLFSFLLSYLLFNCLFLCISHFYLYFSHRERNSLEYFSLNTDTQAGLVLNMFLALEVTLILGFQIIISFTVIKIIQSRYFKIMEKILVIMKELGPNYLLLLWGVWRVSAKWVLTHAFFN